MEPQLGRTKAVEWKVILFYSTFSLENMLKNRFFFLSIFFFYFTGYGQTAGQMSEQGGRQLGEYQKLIKVKEMWKNK